MRREAVVNLCGSGEAGTGFGGITVYRDDGSGVHFPICSCGDESGERVAALVVDFEHRVSSVGEPGTNE